MEGMEGICLNVLPKLYRRTCNVECNLHWTTGRDSKSLRAMNMLLFICCCCSCGMLDGVSPSVFRCTSIPMETGPIAACVET